MLDMGLQMRTRARMGKSRYLNSGQVAPARHWSKVRKLTRPRLNVRWGLNMSHGHLRIAWDIPMGSPVVYWKEHGKAGEGDF